MAFMMPAVFNKAAAIKNQRMPRSRVMNATISNATAKNPNTKIKVSSPLIPAQAGIQFRRRVDPGLRRDER
jgi:hypothetical protein